MLRALLYWACKESKENLGLSVLGCTDMDQKLTELLLTHSSSAKHRSVKGALLVHSQHSAWTGQREDGLKMVGTDVGVSSRWSARMGDKERRQLLEVWDFYPSFLLWSFLWSARGMSICVPFAKRSGDSKENAPIICEQTLWPQPKFSAFSQRT